MQNPRKVYWKAIKYIIQYLKGIHKYWLVFGAINSSLEDFTDSNWEFQKHWHLILGYVFLYDRGEGAISWLSKKQSIIALLSTEAEYVAATHAIKEAIWLQNFFHDIFGTPHSLVTLYCDNQSAIALAYNNAFHARTKHIDICFYFIQETIDSSKILISYCPTNKMAMDLFTKPLACPKVEKFLSLIGLKAI